MPTREQSRQAWALIHAIAATQRLTVSDPAEGGHVCRFCGGDAPWQEDANAYVPVHRLDCPYLGATHLLASMTRSPGPTLSIQPYAFAPLLAHLAARDAESVTLSLDEIETMIGRVLPNSAHSNGGYWTHGTGLSARLRAMGWKPRLRVKVQAVEFRRIPGEASPPNG